MMDLSSLWLLYFDVSLETQCLAFSGNFALSVTS